MDHKEILAECDRLCAMATDKGVKRPQVKAWLENGGFIQVSIWGGHPSIDGGLETFRRTDLRDAIADCQAFIRNMPDPSEIEAREYLKRVASAIDYATENAIADEYLAPLRGVTGAMTENLLTKQETAE